MRTINLYKFNELREEIQLSVMKTLSENRNELKDVIRESLIFHPPAKKVSFGILVSEKLEEILESFKIDRIKPPILKTNSLFVDFNLSLDSIRKLNSYYNLLFDNEMAVLFMYSRDFSRKRSADGIETRLVKRKMRIGSTLKEENETEVFEKMKNVFDKIHSFLSGMELSALHQINTAISDGTFQTSLDQKLDFEKSENIRHDKAFRDSITKSTLEFYEGGTPFGDIYEPNDWD